MGAEHSSLVVDLSGFVPRDRVDETTVNNMDRISASRTQTDAENSGNAARELQAAADVIRLTKDKNQSEEALRRMEAIHTRMQTYIQELQTQNKELHKQNRNLKDKLQRHARMLKTQEKSLSSWRKLYETFGERRGQLSGAKK